MMRLVGFAVILALSVMFSSKGMLASSESELKAEKSLVVYNPLDETLQIKCDKIYIAGRTCGALLIFPVRSAFRTAGYSGLDVEYSEDVEIRCPRCCKKHVINRHINRCLWKKLRLNNAVPLDPAVEIANREDLAQIADRVEHLLVDCHCGARLRSSFCEACVDKGYSGLDHEYREDAVLRCPVCDSHININHLISAEDLETLRRHRVCD